MSIEYGERGKEDIETVPKLGITKGMPVDPVPVWGMRFPGMATGEDMRAAFAGPMVAGIDNIINITTAPKIEPSFFILIRYTIQGLSHYAWKLLENANTLVLFKSFSEDFTIKKLQALNIS